MKKFVCFLTLMLLSGMCLVAQVTTSGISGNVTGTDKSPVTGAVVIATHVPSGSEYTTVVDKKGNFTIHNMRPGGPYKVEFEMLGYKNSVVEDIDLALGDNYVIKEVMEPEAIGIDEVVVTSSKNSIMNSERIGASTNINNRVLTTLPTISRSINDFTRLTPQSYGNSFAGRDGRYNNILIDGSPFNNRFGVSTNNMPGGTAQPIALDAISEITVNVSPFDIRESNFTGASIHAVTRSGDNYYTGSAYMFLRPESFTGDKVREETVRGAKSRSTQIYGVRFGGPIVKDKLFFFVNGEFEKQSSPGIGWIPSVDGNGDAQGMVSRTTVADLQKAGDHLMSKYGYDAGGYSNMANFVDQNYKIMARLDWNINRIHKFTVRYNQVHNTSDQTVNYNSIPWGAGDKSSNRYSIDAFSFGNTNYKAINDVFSLTGELNSNFNSKVSNKLLVSYNSSGDPRSSKSDPFPFVDIMKDGKQYMSLGYELFSWNNNIQNRVLTITDNVSISLGSHNLVAGVSFEKQYFKNSFQRYGLGYYRYNSLDDFINNNKPAAYGITYPYGGQESPGVELDFGLVSAYLQDEIKIGDKLKVTAGIRFELPIYMNNIDDASNTSIKGVKVSEMAFDNGRSIDMGVWPKSKLAISPRVGFNWDVNGDRTIQVRGGTGIFTGFIPFVWFTNQPNAAGLVQSPEIGLKGDKLPDDFRFEADYRKVLEKYPSMFPQSVGEVAAGSSFAKVNDNFKLPQVWRTDLATDIQLPWSTVMTLEAIFSKDINSVIQRNINLPTATQGNFTGADNRPYWTVNKINPSVGTVMVLDNISKGYQASFTAQFTKHFKSGLSGMVSYTYAIAKDLSNNPGYTASSVWSNNSDVNNLNYPALSYSNFSVPHKVTGYISYRKEYARSLATTVSLFYNGMNSGRMSFIYSNDMNGDGNVSDLIFVPNDRSQILLVDKDGYSAEQQYEDLFGFIGENNYLDKRRGDYAERFGALKCWVNRFDLKILQDVFSNFGSDRRYSLQLSLDILNVGNLLNSNWGTTDFYGLTNYENIMPLTYAGRTDNGTPKFTLNAKNHEDFKSRSVAVGELNTKNTWGMMLGVRFMF